MKNLLGLVAAALLTIAAPAHAGKTDDVRIGLIKDAQKIDISGRDLRVLDTRTGKIVLKSSGTGLLSIQWRDLGVSVNGTPVASEKIVVAADPPSFSVGTRKLSGELEIVRHEEKGLTLVNRVDLERYLVGLINHEISSGWPPESVKAQAVVARTYALYRKEQSKYIDYDLESSTLDQVYSGTNLEDSRSLAAVAGTRDQVLSYEGEVIATFYHACCGGHTELPQHVWGGNYNGLSAVACEYCSASPAYFWKREVNARDLARTLTKNGFDLQNVKRLQALASTPFGRVLTLEVSDGSRSYRLTGNQFRKALGYQSLMSTYFHIETPAPGLVQFVGGGNGHGVGMCQWGARGMAEEGFTYTQILKHYYPDASLGRRKLWVKRD